jgi:hypothetical protein
MAAPTNSPTLADRTATLLANTAIFYLAFLWATPNWLPTGGLESVWLLSAFALWFLRLLSAPFFVPPRDALSNAITATCILVTVDLGAVPKFQNELNTIRWAAVAYCAAVAGTSLASLFIHSRTPDDPVGRLLFRLTATFGQAELFYTPPALISILGAYQTSLPTIGWLLVLWTIFLIAEPIAKILEALARWRADSLIHSASPSVGIIERIDFPNIIRVRLTKHATWKPGALHVAAMSNGEQQFVISLFAQVQGSDVMGTGLCIAVAAEPAEILAGHVHSRHDPAKAAEFIENLSGAKGAELVGFTVENSSIGNLRFEVAATCELSEGDVVFEKVSGQDVFYQILDAETSEESFDQNPRGTHIVRAAQLGCYDPSMGFTKHPWLPTMNSPLFWAKSREFPESKLTANEFVIGNVPSTNISVVAKVSELVEYHTAILGVTGTGKTELALDCVRQAVERGVKVFCVDFTGEYRQRLADLDPIFPAPSEQAAADLAAKLFEAETGPYGGGAEKKKLEEALKTMKTGIAKQIDDFLTSKSSLAVFELAEIANTKATLRLTELYLSAIMNWARQHRKARQILIVLEEAHTIIPEVFGAGFDYDTQWVVGRIGQIALQGRKYGVGLMVVSQRTALVSKTILSQCNTFLTHSLIDQTSLNFLQSVYSETHTRSIPNLRFLEFLAFGKAIRSERPILLKRPFDQSKKDASDRLRMPLAGEQSQEHSRPSTPSVPRTEDDLPVGSKVAAAVRASILKEAARFGWRLSPNHQHSNPIS